MKTPPYYLIQSFLAFCSSKSLIEASLKLGISQPALTSHLAQFEENFDHDVFIMQGRKKELSLFGQKLYQYFYSKLGSIEEDLKQIQFEFLQPSQAQIKIGARSEILNYFSDRITFPGYICFEDIDGAKAVEYVISKKLDLAISNHLEKAQDLIFKKAFTDQFVLLCPKKYLKNNQLDSDKMKSIMQYPYISYKGEDVFLSAILNHYKITNIPKPHRIISNWLTIVRIIQKGQGWSLVPKLYCDELQNMTTIDLKNIINTETQFYFLYRKEFRKVKWFQSFIESIKL